MERKKAVSVPFLKSQMIKAKADQFRTKYWGNSVPVDIEKIIEFKLGIEVVPIPSLRALCDIEAGITSNWKRLYVDRDSYEDDRCLPRLRFSFAHEIGHFVLHKEAYEALNIKTIEDFYSFTEEKIIEDCKFHNYVESQASIFANMLLVSREELFIRKSALLKSREDELRKINGTDKELLNSYLAKPLASDFFVSEDVMTIALNYLDNDLKK